VTATEAHTDVPAELVAHLSGWVGTWPPGVPPAVAGNPRNAAPGWDGAVHPVTGVVAPDGAVAVGVPPMVSAEVRARATDLAALLRDLPHLLGRPAHLVRAGVFRWTTQPAPLDDSGEWVPYDDPGVPEWLRPFGGAVLIARDERGRYLAGVGIKRHDAHGHELSVGTEPHARGQGLARRLVAQAARHVLAAGAVPTYLHDPHNLASARVAEAAGFPDRGWQVLGLFGPAGPDAESRD
jgi:GNAT superfamily N-acetyltransferase